MPKSCARGVYIVPKSEAVVWTYGPTLAAEQMKLNTGQHWFCNLLLFTWRLRWSLQTYSLGRPRDKAKIGISWTTIMITSGYIHTLGARA